MVFKLFLDNNRVEEVHVYAQKKTSLVDAIEKLVLEDGVELIGYKDKEAITIDLITVSCFSVIDNKVYALVENEKLLLKFRLYQLEEKLPDYFIKINQSCIANIKQIKCFDASIAGALMVKFKNGYEDYVSRRQLKCVKERMGL